MQAEMMPDVGAKDIAKLEESFRVFTKMTRDLETAYKSLTRRASRIDVELRRANEALEAKVAELERLTRTKNEILDALPNGVLVVDPTGAIVSVNPAAARLLGRSGVELIGRSKEALVGPTGDQLLVTSADAKNAASTTVEKDVTCLDGSRRRLSIVRLVLADGVEVQTLSDMTVLTRLKQHVTRLDTLAALGEMAAGVAHEIRNPLNGIDGFASLLDRAVRSQGADASSCRYAENIRRGVREINDIVTNLLHFAATERIGKTSVSLGALLLEVIDDMRRYVREGRAIEFSPRSRTMLDRAAVTGDAVKLKSVFVNLVKNAVEASPPSGVVTIETSVEGSERRAVIAISDSGQGLPSEIKERLFRPFSTTKAEGTGLGLALAHRFVTLHGGDIRHEDLEPGTRFIVTLPFNAEESRS